MNSSLASPKDKPMKDLSQYTTAQCRLHTQECLSKILPRYPTMQMDVVNPGLKKSSLQARVIMNKGSNTSNVCKFCPSNQQSFGPVQGFQNMLTGCYLFLP